MSIRMTDEEFRRLFAEEEQQEVDELKQAKIQTEKAKAERLRAQTRATQQKQENINKNLSKTDKLYLFTVLFAAAVIISQIIFFAVLISKY